MAAGPCPRPRPSRRRRLLRIAEHQPLADQDARVNAILVEGQALPQVVRHDGFDWHIHAVPHEAPLATRMAVEAAMALRKAYREPREPDGVVEPDTTGPLADRDGADGDVPAAPGSPSGPGSTGKG